MPLKRKLLMAIVVPVFFLCVIGYVSISSIHRLEKAAENILIENYQSIQDARRMEKILKSLEQPPVDAMNDNGAEKANSSTLTREFDEALQRCEQNITEPGEHDILVDVKHMWNEIRPKLVRTHQEESNIIKDSNDRIVLITPIYHRIDDIVALNEKAMFDHEYKTSKYARQMVVVLGSSLGITVLALIFFAIISANRISKPILKVADDLHSALESSHRQLETAEQPADEIERLKSELDDLLARLSHYEDEQTQKLARLQARLAFIIEEVKEGLVLLDEKLNVLSLNRVGGEILGLETNDDENKSLYQLNLGGEFLSALRPVVEEGSTSERELPEIRSNIDGEEMIYRPRLLPFTSSTGEVEGYLLVFWDVTEERRFEESRRRFISMLSHQLKTPMTSLSMSVNLLNEKFYGKTEDSDDLLRMARSDCATLSSLVTELIGASLEATPNLSLSPRRVELVKLLRNSLRPLISRAEDKNIDIHDEFGSTMAFVKVDPVKFPWVVTNIVGNALRYTEPQGSVTLRIEASGENVEITISDTGIGIAQEDLKRLFFPYTSLGDHSEPDSIGLGLTIAKEIVEAHRGTIEVESELGKGTTFRIKIPTSRKLNA